MAQVRIILYRALAPPRDRGRISQRNTAARRTRTGNEGNRGHIVVVSLPRSSVPLSPSRLLRAHRLALNRGYELYYRPAGLSIAGEFLNEIRVIIVRRTRGASVRARNLSLALSLSIPLVCAFIRWRRQKQKKTKKTQQESATGFINFRHKNRSGQK